MKYLVTGGAGFIGSNLTAHLLDCGHFVILYDNMSRPNVIRNVNWLREIKKGHFSHVFMALDNLVTKI